MFLYHLKRIWQLTKKHSRAYSHDIHWHFSHVRFYANRISKHFKDKRYDPKQDRYWDSLPLDPKKYPFDKEKAEAALYEVREWIREDDNNRG